MTTLENRLQDALGAGYRIERELGGGGMSRVFIAEEVELGRNVVVKVLPPDMAAGLNAERFRREIQLAASLQHPHIVPLIAAGRAGDLVWYTMPLIEGESLRARLSRSGELPVSDAVRVLRDVADALSYAHTHGVVHRDIKPDNVLLSGKHAVVTDFGVAKAVSASTGESSLTSIGVALGTPAYMAPEQASADPQVDHRADIYAFGAMAYEMLTGRPPFVGPPQMILAAHVTQTPDPVSTRRQSVPPALAGFIMRCLEKKPADRYQTAAELHEQLELMATPSGGAQPTTAVAPAVGNTRWRVPVWAASAAVIALATVGAFLWRPWSDRSSTAGLSPGVVAVLPFRVAGADPSLHYLRQGMLDLLQAKLTGEGGPRAADARSVLAAFREAGGTDQDDVPDNALLGIARKVGAGRVLQGSVVGPPTHVVITAAVLEMPGARTIAQTSVEGPKDSLFTMVDRLTAQVLALGAGATQQQLSALTTVSVDALRAYLDGQAAYRRGAFRHATESYQRAVQIDSTFALALSELIESAGWSPGGAPLDLARVRRLAWQYRDRLSARDQRMLSLRLGPSYPRSSPWTARIADRERATAEMPENPQAWYYLGDALFHFGALADIPSHLERARAAFEQANRLDSAYGGPVTHLSTVSFLMGDTAGVRRWTQTALALDSTDLGSQSGQFELAIVRRDAEKLRALASVPPPAPGAARLLNLYGHDSVVIAHADELLGIASAQAGNADSRGFVLSLRMNMLVNRGRFGVLRGVFDSLRTASAFPRTFAVWSAILYDGDTTGLGPLAEADERFRYAWRLFQGDASSTSQFVSRLRTDPALADTIAGAHLRYAAMLEAWAAVVRGDADAAARVRAADSLAVGWQEGSDFVSPVVARLYQRVGDPQSALRVLRRRQRMLASRPIWGLASDALIEARAAVATGDRDAAIKAYRLYLWWRSDPEQRLIPQRDSARAELARLTGR